MKRFFNKKAILLTLAGVIAAASIGYSALPNRLRSARLTNATIGDQIDDQIGLLEAAICDLLGIPINTDVSNPLFDVVAGGLRKIFLQDLATDATVAGQVSRNGAALQFHDGTAVRALVKSNLQVLGGNGLTGGGALTGDISLHLDAPISVTVITASGEWSKPSGLVYARIVVIGGGGGGGGVDTGGTTAVAGGGGGGSYAESLIAAGTLGSTETVTIGAGGAGGVTGGPSGQDGVAGGDTSFGAHVIAKGGSGGGGVTASADVGAGGSGGVGSDGTGQVEISGNDGDHGNFNAGNFAIGGHGGGPVFGASVKGPLQKSSGATAGNAGKNYGGGGSGAAALADGTSVAGGAGAAGVIIVVAY